MHPPPRAYGHEYIQLGYQLANVRGFYKLRFINKKQWMNLAKG